MTEESNGQSKSEVSKRVAISILRENIEVSSIDTVYTSVYTLYLQRSETVKSQIVKWGNSLAVRIPQVIAKDARISEGDSVTLTSSEEGRLEIVRAAKTPSLSELVAQITPENRHAEVPLGRPVGKESSEW